MKIIFLKIQRKADITETFYHGGRWDFLRMKERKLRMGSDLKVFLMEMQRFLTTNQRSLLNPKRIKYIRKEFE